MDDLGVGPPKSQCESVIGVSRFGVPNHSVNVEKADLEGFEDQQWFCHLGLGFYRLGDLELVMIHVSWT